MSEETTADQRPLDAEQRVRDNTGPAAVVGAILIVYGFFVYDGPSGEGWFLVGDALFLYGLRLGGLTMIGVAIWSAVGHAPALLADAIVSLLMGFVMFISPALMFAGGGFQIEYLLYAVFALMFWRAAGNIANVYRAIVVLPADDSDGAGGAPGMAVGRDIDSSFYGDPRDSASPAESGETDLVSMDDRPIRTKRFAAEEAPGDAIRLDDPRFTPPEKNPLARIAGGGKTRPSN